MSQHPEYIEWPGDATFPGAHTFPGWDDRADGSTTVHAHNGAEWTEVFDSEVRAIVELSDAQNNGIISAIRSDGGGMVYYYEGSGYPPLVGKGLGDTARGKDAVTGDVLAEYRWTGTTWVAHQLDNAMVSTLDVGKLSAGTATIDTAVAQKIAATSGKFMELDVSQLTAGSAGVNDLTANKIWAGIVSAKAVETNKITANMMAAGTITAESGVIGSIDAGRITAGVLSADRIASGSITAAKLNTGDVQANVVRTADIDAGQIKTGYIDAARIKANSITSQMLSADSINGKVIHGGTLIAGSSSTGTVTAGPVGSSYGVNITTPSSGSANYLIGSTGPYLQFKDGAGAETFYVDGAGNFRMKDRVRGGTVALDNYLASWTFTKDMGNWWIAEQSKMTAWEFFNETQYTVMSPTGRLKLEHRITYDQSATAAVGMEIQLGLYQGDPSSQTNPTSNLWRGHAWVSFRADLYSSAPSFTASEVVDVTPGRWYWVRAIWRRQANASTLPNTRYWSQCQPV